MVKPAALLGEDPGAGRLITSAHRASARATVTSVVNPVAVAFGSNAALTPARPPHGRPGSKVVVVAAAVIVVVEEIVEEVVVVFLLTGLVDDLDSLELRVSKKAPPATTNKITIKTAIQISRFDVLAISSKLVAWYLKIIAKLTWNWYRQWAQKFA